MNKNSKYLGILIGLIVVLLSFSPDSLARRRYPKIHLKEALRVELNGVLEAASSLHQACFQQSESAIESSMRDLIFKLSRAQEKSNLAPAQETHLNKMLSAARESLEEGQRQRGKDRKQSLAETFRQLVQIVRVFDVDKYRVFFCSKDKKVWLQKGWKAQNPFNPKKFKNCGKMG